MHKNFLLGAWKRTSDFIKCWELLKSGVTISQKEILPFIITFEEATFYSVLVDYLKVIK